MRVTEPYTIFERTLPSGRKIFYYQYRDKDGHRTVSKSTGCTSLSAARRYCQKLYNSGGFEAQAHEQGETFAQFAGNFFAPDSDYCQWKAATNGRPLKPKTIESYQTHLQFQLMPFFAEKKLKKK